MMRELLIVGRSSGCLVADEVDRQGMQLNRVPFELIDSAMLRLPPLCCACLGGLPRTEGFAILGSIARRWTANRQHTRARTHSTSSNVSALHHATLWRK